MRTLPNDFYEPIDRNNPNAHWTCKVTHDAREGHWLLEAAGPVPPGYFNDLVVEMQGLGFCFASEDPDGEIYPWDSGPGFERYELVRDDSNLHTDPVSLVVRDEQGNVVASATERWTSPKSCR